MADIPDILRRICAQRRLRVPLAGLGCGIGGVDGVHGDVGDRSHRPAVPGGAATSGDSASGADSSVSLSGLAPDATGRRFLEAVEERRGRAVIAEIKMGSPKLGDLRGRFDPVARAETYAAAGAACLSVVVEPDHFFGSYELLAECAAASGLPAVAKDFVVSDVQLDWAREAGASAVLLIAALHDAAELRRLADAAHRRGLVPLVETHDEADFEKLRAPAAEGAGAHPASVATEGAEGREGGKVPAWQLVGINNRDLRTFEVDIERSAALVGRLPQSALKVAESGIHTGADVAKLREAGFDAFLIGERLVLSRDPAGALARLLDDMAPPGTVYEGRGSATGPATADGDTR